jgi:glyoxylate/hydroxypyruvate reductase A
MAIFDTPLAGALVFYSDFDDFQTWKQALHSHLPQLQVLHASEVQDPLTVHYALVWKPPMGFFEPMRNLRLLINLGAGVDSLVHRNDLPAHVHITRIEDPHMARMMASYVLFAVLRHARDIPHFEQAQRRAQWAYLHPRTPESTTVAVLGLGQLGATAAREIQRQGFRTLGWSRSQAQIEGVECYAGAEALDSILQQADIVVLMLPDTPQTRGLMSAEKLQKMKHGASLINVARGTLVDQTAMTTLLEQGHLRSATLDVFAVEPLPAEDKLWQMPNVLITPHLASVAIPSSSAQQMVKDICRVSRGEPPGKTVDRLKGY